ncbi:MAG: Aminobenzoate synthetase [Pedobacter sp.]|nr:Aminobenzoate synthetase [Pedobacter sp.]
MHSDPFKEKAIRWADQFEHCCVLDSNGYTDLNGRFNYLVAAGSKHILYAGEDAFKELKNFQETYRTWMFGYLGYDLKNQLETLISANKDSLFFPDMFFFIPEYVIAVSAKGIEVLLGSADILGEIASFPLRKVQLQQAAFTVDPAVCKDDYINNVKAIKEHINRGDIYELTYCQEFFAENASIDPLQTYMQLNALSPTPFAGYLKLKNKYILCASPERFLCKTGTRLISQPIKGTARRGKTVEEDLQSKLRLTSDLKEQTENVMIVDLVRNDLTKSAIPGSVSVTELFGIYTFPQVHQMISTVACELAPEVHFIDAIKNAFPMGSMTGAPKIRAMQLIETYERSKRGVYSGAMGYISPDGDFDLNVIIRSILYEAERQYLSFQVGGAITYASDPEKEYQECLLKASAILETIKGPL